MFPAYQRTHVTTNAIGLLLAWCLDPPSAGGLGLRRVQYQTNEENQASMRTAERMCFAFELVQKYRRVVKGGDCHSAMLAMTWEDWRENGVREKVLAMMERKV